MAQKSPETYFHLGPVYRHHNNILKNCKYKKMIKTRMYKRKTNDQATYPCKPRGLKKMFQS